MEYETVARGELLLAGLETGASNANPQKIGDLWARFLRDELVQKIDWEDEEIIAVYCEYESDHTAPYTFFLGRRVPLQATLPEGIVRRHILGGTFARFVSEGEQPQALMETWKGIWELSLKRRYEVDFEIHSGSRVEIFVGI